MKNKLNPMHTIQEAGSYSDEETASSSSFSSRESIASHQICASSSETATALTGRDTAARRVHEVEKVNINDGDNADAEEETPHWLSFLFCWGGSPTSSDTDGDNTILQDKLLEEMLQVDKYNTEQSKNHRILQDYTSSYSTSSIDTQTSNRIDNITNCSNKGSDSDNYSDDRSDTSKSSNGSLEEGSSSAASSPLQYSSSSSSSSGKTLKNHRELKTTSTIGSTTPASKATILPCSSNVSKLSKLFSRNAVKSFDSKGKPPLPPRTSTTAKVTTTFSSEQTLKNSNERQLQTSSASELPHSSRETDKNVLSSAAMETHATIAFPMIHNTEKTDILPLESISGIENHLLPTESSSTKKVVKPEVIADTQILTFITSSHKELPARESDAVQSSVSTKNSSKKRESGPLESAKTTFSTIFSSLSTASEVNAIEKNHSLPSEGAMIVGKQDCKAEATLSTSVSQCPTELEEETCMTGSRKSSPAKESTKKIENGPLSSEKVPIGTTFLFQSLFHKSKETAIEKNGSLTSEDPKLDVKQGVKTAFTSSTLLSQGPTKLAEEIDEVKSLKSVPGKKTANKIGNGPPASEKATTSTFDTSEAKAVEKRISLSTEGTRIVGKQNVETDNTSTVFFAQGPPNLVEETFTEESRKSASTGMSAMEKECFPLASKRATVSTILSSLFFIPPGKKGSASSFSVAKSSVGTKVVEKQNILASSSNASSRKQTIKTVSNEPSSNIFPSSPSKARMVEDEQLSLADDEEQVASNRLAESHSTATLEKSVSRLLGPTDACESNSMSKKSEKSIHMSTSTNSRDVSSSEKIFTEKDCAPSNASATFKSLFDGHLSNSSSNIFSSDFSPSVERFLQSFSSEISSMDMGEKRNTSIEDMDTLMSKNSISSTKTGNVSDAEAVSKNRLSPNKPGVSIIPVTTTTKLMTTRNHALSHYSGKMNNEILPTELDKNKTYPIIKRKGELSSVLFEPMPTSVNSTAQEMKNDTEKATSTIKCENAKIERASKLPKSKPCINSPMKEEMKSNKTAATSFTDKGDNVVKVFQRISRDKDSGSTITYYSILTKRIGLQKKKNASSSAVTNKEGRQMIQRLKNKKKGKSYLPMNTCK